MPHATWPVPPDLSSARGLGAAVLTAGCGVGGGCSTRCASAGLTPCRDRAASEFGATDGLGLFSPRKGGRDSAVTPVASLTGIRSAALAEGDEFLDGGLVVPGRGTDWQAGLSTATPRLGDDARMYWLVVGGCGGWDAYVLSEERMSGAGYGGYSVVTHLRGRRVSLNVPVGCGWEPAVANFQISMFRRSRRSLTLTVLGWLNVRAAVKLSGAGMYLVGAHDPTGAMLDSESGTVDAYPSTCGGLALQMFIDANVNVPRRMPALVSQLDPTPGSFVGGAVASLQSTYDRLRSDELFQLCLPEVADWCDHCDAVINDPGPSGHGGTEDTSP